MSPEKSNNKQKDSLSQIKTGSLSRGLALARVSVSAGARAASHALGSIFSDETQRAERYRELLMKQVNELSRELGELKGSLMKVGQMLSMYGEQFLPPEANALLKSLQSEAPPLDWSAIEKTIRRQLTPEQLATVEIDPHPIASASLGQVHRARRKSDGKWLAMKVQYPGVDQAIEGDLKALRSILSLIHLVPRGPKYESLFKEVKFMLQQEVNYSIELETTREFKDQLAGDPRFIVPEVFPELSTKRILTTSLEEGIPVDGPEVLALSQERRNSIGIAMMDLYFQEIFHLGAVQTDPHFGNYRIRLGQGDEPDRIVLLDFGAVRKLPKSFWNLYLELVAGAHERDPERLIRGATEMGFLTADDSDELKKNFVEFCYLITEPFYSPGGWPEDRVNDDDSIAPKELFDHQGAYIFGGSDLPKRVAKKGALLAVSARFRSPPREIVFLDRKLGGIFIFLSVLKVQVKCRSVIQKYLDERKSS
jgi:predicted unusual protein kinase regulating ubiquinone biosynthesis (AarF/ABC1/UbiB family)